MTDLPDYVLKAMNRLEEAGYECYVVGGAVRSAILHAPVHDYDLTSNALPSQMKEVFSDWHTIETGIKHGTLTVMSDHHPLEITTYRKDTGYKDHRHPDSVEFTSQLEEDCARRDFTVNALCYNPKEGLKDFFHGMDDIHAGIIRCIGNPYDRFDEDALRILRAIRFASQLNFSIENTTAQAVLALSDTLTYVSAERIRDEFTRFLSYPGAAQLFFPYRKVFSVFLPELSSITKEDMDTLIQRLYSSRPEKLIRMAVLLSAPCFEHPSRILNRLRFSNQESRAVLDLIRFRNAPMNTIVDIRKLMRDLHTDFILYLHYREGMDSCRYVEAYSLYEQMIRNGDCTSLKDMAVNGSDLVRLGYRGKEISETLSLLLEKVIEEKLPNDRNVLLDYLSSITR